MKVAESNMTLRGIVAELSGSDRMSARLITYHGGLVAVHTGVSRVLGLGRSATRYEMAKVRAWAWLFRRVQGQSLADIYNRRRAQEISE